MNVLRALAWVLVATPLAGLPNTAVRAAAADARGEVRDTGAVWMLFGSLLSLEQQGPSQSWRWLEAEAGLGPEAAGMLLAYAIESVAALSNRADRLHAQNCEALEAQDPTLDDIAALLERTNAALGEFRRQRVAGLRDVLEPADRRTVVELAVETFDQPADPLDFDFHAFLEARGQSPATLVHEMCAVR
jgi:hypothetical protein